MDFIYKLHSGVRWIIVLVAVVALVRFLLVWIGRMKPGSADRGLMSAFVGLLDLQFLLGVVLIYLLRPMERFRLEHAVTMLLAVITGHLSAKWKNAPPTLRARNYLLIIVIALILIFVGVARLPQGWKM